jgi:hypothetical protein
MINQTSAEPAWRRNGRRILLTGVTIFGLVWIIRAYWLGRGLGDFPVVAFGLLLLALILDFVISQRSGNNAGPGTHAAPGEPWFSRRTPAMLGIFLLLRTVLVILGLGVVLLSGMVMINSLRDGEFVPWWGWLLATIFSVVGLVIASIGSFASRETFLEAVGWILDIALG